MKLYVRMTDKFMSGWGMAEGKANVLVIECDDWQQAAAIKAGARRRSEMRRIRICSQPPRNRSGVLHTRRHFAEFAGDWVADYAGAKP